MATVVTIRLVELEPSAGDYDGSKIDANAGGYVETNQTYTTVSITNSIELDNSGFTKNFIKRILAYIFGIPRPTAEVEGYRSSHIEGVPRPTVNIQSGELI